MKTKANLTRLISFAFVLLLYFLSLHNLMLQRQHFHNLLNETSRLKLRRFITVLKAKSEPGNLLRNLVFSKLKKIGKISHENRESLKAELFPCLGNQSKMLLLDSNLEVILSKNLNDQQKQTQYGLLKYFFKHSLRSLTNVEKDDARFLSEKEFQLSVMVHHFRNLQNAVPAKHHGQPGMLFIGIIPSSLHKKALRHFSIGLENAKTLAQNNYGLYLIFVPETVFNNESWHRRNLLAANWNQNLSSIIGTKDEIADLLAGTGRKNAADRFSENLLKEPSGAFVHGNRGYAYTAVASYGQKQLYVFHDEKLPELPVFISEKTALVLHSGAAFFLLLLILKLSKESSSWNLSIKTKFLIISFFAALFPVAGMLFQESSRSSLNQFVKENQIFSQLEDRFSQLENKIDIRLSDVFDCMDIIKNSYQENSITNHARFLKDLRQIRQRRIYHFVVSESGGRISLIDTDTGDDSRINRPLKTILNGLAVFSIKNLNLHDLMSPALEKNLHNSLVLETMTEGFPKEQLYQLSLNIRKFQPFKLGRESIWIFSDFVYDGNGNPEMHCFMIVDGNRIISEIIDGYQSNLSLSFPEMLFFIKLGPYSSMTPAWGEDKPELITLMEIAGSEGEIVRQTLSLHDQKLYLFGRRLKGQEWAALSIKYEKITPEKGLAISWAAVFAIAYVVLVLLILTAYFQQFFSRPVNQIRNAVTEMAGGNYKLKLAVESRDELGQLSLSFNQMAAELEEKEYLSRFLSELAREAISGTRSISGAKINGTILFSDIRDFTTLTEKQSAEDIVEMLNDYMTEMETVIERHHGSIEKYIGDAIMAVFLPELGQAAPAQRAAQAALEMGTALAEFNRMRVAKQQFLVKNGVGIATGELLMGSMGSLQGQQRYTVTGATVNLAAEMEKRSKNTGALPIVMCARTAAEVKIGAGRLQKLEVSGSKAAWTVLELSS